MPKKKVIILFVILLIIFVVFATVIITTFYSMRNNPIDKVAMTYLWNESEISNEYGDIVSVNRYVLESEKGTDSAKSVPYSVTTETHSIIVFVDVLKEGDKWIAKSMTIKEVHNVN